MKYFIMCGGNYSMFTVPKQLLMVCGERIVDRTIRLLLENGVPLEDIAITSSNHMFDTCKCKRIQDLKNNFVHENEEKNIERRGFWLDCFYLVDEPATYLYGDVYYSDNAIRTIVNTPTKSILMFGTNRSAYISPYYIKPQWDEPMGFKVIDNKKFKESIDILKQMGVDKKLSKHPISGELYRQINGYPIHWHTIKDNYCAISDYTCDVDSEADVAPLEEAIGRYKKDNNLQ